jgi:hypothetical protein
MLYILRAHRKQAESRRTAAALEAVLDTYEHHCRTLREGAERILAHIEKDAPHEPGKP